MNKCLSSMTVLALVASVAMAAPSGQAPTTQPAIGELRPILSPEAKREAARKLIDKFVNHVGSSESIDASARRAVAEAWNQYREDEHPEDFLPAGVAIVSPPFKTALDALDRQQYAKADEALRPLVNSKDPYVSLHAQALLARSLVEQDLLEEAEQVLTPLAAREKDLVDKTFLEVEVDFLLGYVQLANLNYDAALATLAEFERQHPGAPDRYRLPARQMLQELVVRQPERLGDVSDLMAYAGRRLGHGVVGEPVRVRQDRAVALLEALIKEAEEQEKQGQGCKNCGGKGCKKCGGGKLGGNRTPGSPANQSQLPDGSGRIGELDRSPTARPGEMWGKMRPEERKRILQALSQSFPPRYRQLVEQYYKQLAKEQ